VRSKTMSAPTEETHGAREEVLEIIRELPGSTSAEIRALMPHRKRALVASMLSYLKKRGIIEVSGRKSVAVGDGKMRRIEAYRISDNPTPKFARRARTTPSEAALHELIQALNKQLDDLHAWKTKAIARYPDLMVDPTVAKARKLVAAELRAGGDVVSARHVEKGDRDDALVMRVTIKALEEAE